MHLCGLFCDGKIKIKRFDVKKTSFVVFFRENMQIKFCVTFPFLTFCWFIFTHTSIAYIASLVGLSECSFIGDDRIYWIHHWQEFRTLKLLTYLIN